MEKKRKPQLNVKRVVIASVILALLIAAVLVVILVVIPTVLKHNQDSEYESETWDASLETEEFVVNEDVDRAIQSWVADAAYANGVVADAMLACEDSSEVLNQERLGMLYRSFSMGEATDAFLYVTDREGKILYHPDVDRIGQMDDNTLLANVRENGLRSGAGPVVIEEQIWYVGFYMNENADFALAVMLPDAQRADCYANQQMIYEAHTKNLVEAYGMLMDYDYQVNGEIIYEKYKHLDHMLGGVGVSGLEGSSLELAMMDGRIVYAAKESRLSTQAPQALMDAVRDGDSTCYCYYLTGENKAILYLWIP